MFPNVFLTIGLIEPVPFEIMFTTYPNDAEMLAVSAFVADEPVVWIPSVTLIKPFKDDTNEGSLPPPIILFTTSKPAPILATSVGVTYPFVICVVPLTFNGLPNPQFWPVFCANIDGIADKPLLIIPSTILNELLTKPTSVAVPDIDDVTFVSVVTLIFFSSFPIIRGVSNNIFCTT